MIVLLRIVLPATNASATEPRFSSYHLFVISTEASAKRRYRRLLFYFQRPAFPFLPIDPLFTSTASEPFRPCGAINSNLRFLRFGRNDIREYLRKIRFVMLRIKPVATTRTPANLDLTAYHPFVISTEASAERRYRRLLLYFQRPAFSITDTNSQDSSWVALISQLPTICHIDRSDSEAEISPITPYFQRPAFSSTSIYPLRACCII